MSVICSNSYNFGITKVISYFSTSFQTGIRVSSYDCDDKGRDNVSYLVRSPIANLRNKLAQFGNKFDDLVIGDPCRP